MKMTTFRRELCIVYYHTHYYIHLQLIFPEIVASLSEISKDQEFRGTGHPLKNKPKKRANRLEPNRCSRVTGQNS